MGWAEGSPKERGRDVEGNPGEPCIRIHPAGSHCFPLTTRMWARTCQCSGDVTTTAGEGKHPQGERRISPCSSARWFSRFLDPSLCSSAWESGTPSSRESLVTSWALQLVIFLEPGAVVPPLSMPYLLSTACMSSPWPPPPPPRQRGLQNCSARDPVLTPGLLFPSASHSIFKVSDFIRRCLWNLPHFF